MFAETLNTGVVFLDKPRGMTSHDAVLKAKSLLGVGKAGHTGTLDGNSTGLLIILLGESRKSAPELAGLDKEYEGTMHLHSEITEERMREALKKFTGKITQTPPRKSRVSRKPRERVVHSFRITGKEGRDVRFHVSCQAGTYVRKLVSDLGEELGPGAHLKELRRVKIGPFSVDGAVTLEKLSPRDVVPLEEALKVIK